MKRYVYYLLGMNILVLGITCNTLSNLGVGAFSTLPFALSSLSALPLDRQILFSTCSLYFFKSLLKEK